MKTLFSKLTINKINIWQLLLPLLAVANVAYFFHNLIGSFITLGFFLFVPGYLLLSLLKHEIKSSWEILSFSSGLSLLQMIVGGLMLNTLNYFGLEKPLTTFNIFILLNCLTTALLILNRKKSYQLPKLKIRFSMEQIVIILLLSLLPFLAVGGAISLNNGGPNTLTMILFGLIPVLFLWLIFRPGLKSLYSYAVLMIGMSILFTTSPRGWYITGHDIHHEFDVFQNTYNNSLWPVRLVTGDPYNACLSITILPTILAKITNIPAMYIYKFVFQIIFSFCLLTIYLFIKRFSNSIHALIGSFIFISFPTFFNDMPFLNRQEIAFVFFGLLVLTTFTDMKKGPKLILSITLLISIMFSHYSSNYITLALLTSSWLIYNFLKRIQVIKSQFEIPILRLPIIFGAFFLTFLWNSQITVSASNLESSVIQTINDFRYKRSVHDRFLSYGLIEQTTIDLQKRFEDFAQNKSNSAKYVPAYNLPLTNLGKAISGVADVKNLNYGMHTFVAKIYQILLILGIVMYFFKQRQLAKKEKTYYFAIIASSLALLVTFTILPRLATDYTITRLMQQTLILTALPIIIAGEFIFIFLRRFKLPAVALVFIILFLHSSGLIPQLTGGYRPQLALNNAGFYYDFFYTHGSDILASKWLANNRDKNMLIFVDTTSGKPSLDYPVYKGLLNKPGQISNTSGYLYLDYTNVQHGVYRIALGDLIEYSDPLPTLQRNLLYSNQESHIYGRR